MLNERLTGRDYTYHADFDYASSVVSPCNFATPFYLSGDLRVNNSMNTQGNGYIAVDSVSADPLVARCL